MKIPALAAILSAALATSCVTPHQGVAESNPASQRIASEITPQVISQLSALLSKNPDLLEAYLVTAPQAGSYALVPVFEGSPNMTSLYEAVDLFKKLVPTSQLDLALLTPATRKQMLGGSEPFYVRP
jgi:hypothetical protein